MSASFEFLKEFAARLAHTICAGRALDDPCFDKLARELFRAQAVLNPAYGRLVAARGLDAAAAIHWREIPAMPTSAFKDLDLSCLPAGARTSVFHSSGTTGERRSRHFHNPDSTALYETSALQWFTTNTDGMMDRLRQRTASLAILTPPPPLAPHSSLVAMFEAIRRATNAPATAFLGTTGAESAWVVESKRAARALQDSAAASRPLLLLGTAFSFVHLLDYLEAAGARLALPAGSLLMETGGYKGRSRELPQPELHAWITRRLGVPPARILREYGMSELSSQAYNRDGGPTLHFPPWARAVVVSPETGVEAGEGAEGLLRVHDLANVFSVAAIQTEDLAVRRGDGFVLLGRARHAEPRGCSLAAAELESPP